RHGAERRALEQELADLWAAHDALEEEALDLEVRLRAALLEERALHGRLAPEDRRLALELRAIDADGRPRADVAPVLPPDREHGAALLLAELAAAEPLLEAARAGRALLALHVRLAPQGPGAPPVRARLAAFEPEDAAAPPAGGELLEGPVVGPD